MSRDAYAYTFVAVEISFGEMRKWLKKNRKDYSDSDYAKGKEYEHVELNADYYHI